MPDNNFDSSYVDNIVVIASEQVKSKDQSKYSNENDYLYIIKFEWSFQAVYRRQRFI